MVMMVVVERVFFWPVHSVQSFLAVGPVAFVSFCSFAILTPPRVSPKKKYSMEEGNATNGLSLGMTILDKKKRSQELRHE
jgi:hypothetical protein